MFLIIKALWFILPAYFANAAPVLLGGGIPIDGGKKLSDGQPIFGNGKTIRGFVAGLIAGTAVGGLQGILQGFLHGSWMLGLLLALGALTGDLVGSFIKRRGKLRQGMPALGLDQLDFVVGALLLGALLEVPSLKIIATILIITPLIHVGTNLAAYKLGYKSKPY